MAGDIWPGAYPYVGQGQTTFSWPDPRVDDVLRRLDELEKRVAELEPHEPTTCTRNDDGSYTFSRGEEAFTIPAHEVHFLKDIFR